jgi:hypothetical protein
MTNAAPAAALAIAATYQTREGGPVAVGKYPTKYVATRNCKFARSSLLRVPSGLTEKHHTARKRRTPATRITKPAARSRIVARV